MQTAIAQLAPGIHIFHLDNQPPEPLSAIPPGLTSTFDAPVAADRPNTNQVLETLHLFTSGISHEERRKFKCRTSLDIKKR
ncbi:MAG TPA: hypothetical protein PK671_07220 [Candidatus Obscuribacter sp.]|nr:hypothetical protein [Candidatus Obscuribacter sp.]HMY52724.1 hypothetical protein [Candidatus Obscuribacter sp.]HNH73829.1 hypothetical protein [Candidatus Obscuribacter sp.]